MLIWEPQIITLEKIKTTWNIDMQCWYFAWYYFLIESTAIFVFKDKEGLKEKFSDSYRSYVFSTLKLKDDNGYDSFDTRYSSTGRTETAGYVLTYKFADNFDEIIDEDVKKYEEYYKNDFSAADVMSYILLEENSPSDKDGLFEYLTSLLISDQISDDTISDNLDDLKDDTTVKCYNVIRKIILIILIQLVKLIILISLLLLNIMVRLIT